MALFRCSKCNHIREVGREYIGKKVKCPKCKQATSVYDTVTFVRNLVKKYIVQNKELYKLRKEVPDYESLDIKIDNIDSVEDIYNTKSLTQAEKYEPIVKWFNAHKIQVRVDQDAIDTTGFFDEIALLLGNNSKVLKFVTDQIKYIQNKGYTNVKLDISKKGHTEVLEITSFCKELYEYSFVAKYFYSNKDKIIRLTLQTAPKIKAFFNGIWMEWFILMKLLELFRDNNIDASCMRSLNISFKNGDSNELDIFFLTKNNIPICIECKSGEFRQDIDKYLKLKKKLALDKDQFVLCIFGLSKEQTIGMTSMYDLTFVNEESFVKHIEETIDKY